MVESSDDHNKDLNTSFEGSENKIIYFHDSAMDVNFHFQIYNLGRQLYIWVGCNAARMGNLYEAMPTRFDAMPYVSSLIGGGSDTAGMAMTRRLSMKTGFSIIMACDMPSNSPSLEAYAEKRIVQELKSLGLVKPKKSE